jgi:hypothetical protein
MIKIWKKGRKFSKQFLCKHYAAILTFAGFAVFHKRSPSISSRSSLILGSCLCLPLTPRRSHSLVKAVFRELEGTIIEFGEYGGDNEGGEE